MCYSSFLFVLVFIHLFDHNSGDNKYYSLLFIISSPLLTRNWSTFFEYLKS